MSYKKSCKNFTYGRNLQKNYEYVPSPFVPMWLNHDWTLVFRSLKWSKRFPVTVTLPRPGLTKVPSWSKLDRSFWFNASLRPNRWMVSVYTNDDDDVIFVSELDGSIVLIKAMISRVPSSSKSPITPVGIYKGKLKC